MKPLLAASFDKDLNLDFQLKLLPFPLVGSPKIDGARALCHPDLGGVTRKFTPIKNRRLCKLLSDKRLKGLDGEVCVGEPWHPDVFNRSTGEFRKEDGQADFTFNVFDDFSDPQKPFVHRLLDAKRRVSELKLPWLVFVPHEPLDSYELLIQYQDNCLSKGYEGVMLRKPGGRYKFGRSTMNEKLLIKLKPFEDDEAEVVGYEQRFENTNVATRDALGRSKRGKSKEGMKPLDMLGAWVCRSKKFPRVTFNIGSGFDHEQSREWWKNPQKYVGRKLTYKFQRVGSIDKPRVPIFKGWYEE